MRTRFGSQCELLESTGEGWVLVRRLSDDAKREWWVGELAMDGTESAREKALFALAMNAAEEARDAQDMDYPT